MLDPDLDDKMAFVYWYKDCMGKNPPKDPVTDLLFTGYQAGAQGMRNLVKALQEQCDHFENLLLEKTKKTSQSEDQEV